MKESDRPQTSQMTGSGCYFDQDIPKYKLSVREKAVREKKYDYTKKFSTIPKKCDPVSRMQQLNR